MKKTILTLTFALSASFAVKAATLPSGSEGVGGGNSYDSLMIESYAKPLKSISGYNEYFKPLATDFNSKIYGDLIQVANSLHWYLLPIGMKQVATKATGLPFISDQVAVQKNGEVFIDANLFSQMSVQQRGLLILHETIESQFVFEGGDDPAEQMVKVRAVVNIVKNSSSLTADELHERLKWYYPYLWTVKEVEQWNASKEKARQDLFAAQKSFADTVYPAVVSYCGTIQSYGSGYDNFWRKKQVAAATDKLFATATAADSAGTAYLSKYSSKVYSLFDNYSHCRRSELHVRYQTDKAQDVAKIYLDEICSDLKKTKSSLYKFIDLNNFL